MGESVESPEILRYIICKMFHWDYYTYEAQPSFFIDEIRLCLVQEANRSKLEERKSKAKGAQIGRR